MEIRVTLPDLTRMGLILELFLISTSFLLIYTGYKISSAFSPFYSLLGYLAGVFSVIFLPISIYFTGRTIYRKITEENTVILINFGIYMIKKSLVLYFFVIILSIMAIFVSPPLIFPYFLYGCGIGLIFIVMFLKTIFY